MEKKEIDPKYFTSLQKLETLLLRLESDMAKVFKHNATARPEKWMERLHQSQNVLTLCSDELCSWLTFWGLDNLGEKFRLLYHVHKAHLNFMLQDYLLVFKRIQNNAFIGMDPDLYEANYQKLHDQVILKQKSKDELLTMNVFEFQDMERAREAEEAEKKAEEEKKHKEQAARLAEEAALNADIKPVRTEDISVTPAILIDEGTGMIKRLMQIHANTAKDLETFLKERKHLPKHKIEALTNHLKDMLDSAGAEDADSESEDVKDAFAESVRMQEEFKEVLHNFDQKQKDLVVRALVYYRKLNNKVKLDKSTGPDLKIFDLDELVFQKESLERQVNELEKDLRERYGVIQNLKSNLDNKTELLHKSAAKNKVLESELTSSRSQLDLFKKELSSKHDVFYNQAEKVAQLRDQEKIANDLRVELKKTESKLEIVNKELSTLKEEVQLSRSKRDDSFQIEGRERNKTMFEGNRNLDARSVELPIEIEDRQRSKSMVTAVTNFQQEPESPILPPDVLNKEAKLVEIEESESSIARSSESSSAPTPKPQKRLISPLKKKVSAIANFRGNQDSKKGSLLEEILRKQGQDEDSSMMMDLMKDELNAKRSLPVKTMSLVDFGPTQDHIQRLPRLMLVKPRSRKNDIHKRTNQRSELMRSLSPLKQHARSGASPLEELSVLQIEKEKTYQALVERSMGIYKPVVTQNKSNSLQSFRALNLKNQKAKANKLISGSFESDALRSDERGHFDFSRGELNNASYVDFIVDSGTDSAFRSTKEHNPNINIERLDRMHSNVKGLYPSYISSHSTGLDLEEQLTGRAKATTERSSVSDKEIEALYAFLMHDTESAISKIGLMQNMLSNGDRKNQSSLEKAEREGNNVMMLKNAGTFKQTVKEWISEHKNSCGKECYHLQRFYEKIDFRKQFIDIILTKEKNSKKIMKIPLAVLAGPLPAETADASTARKRLKGVI